ncbi:hypothetical protein GCM10023116_17590 [Kistimonas scapharcae]|uniref:Uncharacterized protein n=2 Tax=Kistimonas scapharcae TaxID=1036133 RepID=A0ABP8V072_9GAMM
MLHLDEIEELPDSEALKPLSRATSFQDLRITVNNPPEHMAPYEYFYLSSFLCKRMEDNDFSTYQLFRFAQQATMDLDYLELLAEKVKKMKETDNMFLPKRVCDTIYDNIGRLMQSFHLLRGDLKRCMSAFSDNKRIDREWSVRTVFKDEEERYVVTVSADNMVELCRSKCKSLIFYMDKFRESLPAIFRFYRQEKLPDHMDINNKKSDMSVEERFAKLDECRAKMGRNCDCLQQTLSSSPRQALVFYKQEHHSVHLPDEKPVPPVRNLGEVNILRKEGEQVLKDRRPSSANGWVIEEASPLSLMEPEYHSFNSMEEANAFVAAGRSQQDTECRLEESKVMPAIRLGVDVNPKPKDYFCYQPVPRALLEDILKQGQELVRKMNVSREETSRGIEQKTKLSEKEWQTIDDLCGYVKKFEALWSIFIPSIQTLCDQILEMEVTMHEKERFTAKLRRKFKTTVKGLRRTERKEKAVSIAEEKQTGTAKAGRRPRERHATIGESPSRSPDRSRYLSPTRECCSLPADFSPATFGFQLTTKVIPPTPSPSDNSNSPSEGLSPEVPRKHSK